MNEIINAIQGMISEELTAISMTDAILSVALSFILSLFVVLIYKITYGGVSYSKSFAGCLIMLSMVTSLVILVIASNVVLSLGMVGALSIVRFRTAIKEPSDTAFAFWAIATGIVCGAGYVLIAVLMTVLLGLLFVAVHAVSRGSRKDSYMIIVRYSGPCEIEEELRTLRRYQLKSKTVSADATELVAEAKLSAAEVDGLDGLRRQEGVVELTVMRSVSGSVL